MKLEFRLRYTAGTGARAAFTAAGVDDLRARAAAAFHDLHCMPVNRTGSLVVECKRGGAWCAIAKLLSNNLEDFKVALGQAHSWWMLAEHYAEVA